MICAQMAHWEETECLRLHFATLDWMDRKVEALVRNSCTGTMLMPWPHELYLRKNPWSSWFVGDFTYSLVRNWAFESARTFIISKSPSKRYLSHLLGSVVVESQECAQHGFIIDLPLQFAKWLMEHGADLFVQCSQLFRRLPVFQSKVWSRLLQTPMNTLIGMFCSRYEPAETTMPPVSTAVEDIMRMIMWRVPDDTIVKLCVLDGKYINEWLDVKEFSLMVGHSVLFSMNVHGNDLRQKLAAHPHAGNEMISEAQGLSLK